MKPNYQYDFEKRWLVLFTEKTQKVFFSMSGPAVHKFFINTSNPYKKTMNIHTSNSLLYKINKLNKWLVKHNGIATKEYKLKEQNRNYYVNKLLDLNTSGMMVIRA